MSKAYSRLGELPRGRASERITPGCLVLEGGALRGTYSVGVMDALMEADINLQATVGVSAGALNGISYVSGQIGRSARSPLTYRHDQRYFGLRAYLRNKSPFGFDFMFGELTYKLDPLDIPRFMHPSRRFACAVTNCRTGQPEFFEKGDSLEDIFIATRASSTMPYISEMVDIKGQPYLDGGCSLKIPHRWALEQGFEKIVVIKTYPNGFRRKVKSGSRAASLVYGKRWPNLAAALARSNADYNQACDELDQLSASGRAFVIAPSRDMHIGRMEQDLEKLGDWYWLGYHDAKAQMDGLRKYLEG
jgi:predicted patatin/cPLA2 family phospholipase